MHSPSIAESLGGEVHTVYFWPGLQESFTEVYRVLKTGGNFFLCNEIGGEGENGKHWEKKIEGMHIYTPEQLKTMLEEIGFTNITIHRNQKKHWFCMSAVKGGRI